MTLAKTIYFLNGGTQKKNKKMLEFKIEIFIHSLELNVKLKIVSFFD
jgi:hypothetical protein